MSENPNNESDLNDVPEAVVQTRRQISIVWVVPIVAVLIGGWLAFKAISENNINVSMIAQGSSELNISFVVKAKNCREAVASLHSEFRLGKP